MTNKSKKIMAEISAGELLDKISILEIKLDKIKDKISQDEIAKEYKLLKDAQNFNIEKNRFRVKAGLTRKEWLKKGWIFKEDPLGWFQWYCRFQNGRRIPHIDEIQIKRWKAFKRHVTAIKKNCEQGDIHCRRRQRQAILQWAYNPFI